MAAQVKDQGREEVAVARPTGKAVDLDAFARKMQTLYPRILKRLGE